MIYFKFLIQILVIYFVANGLVYFLSDRSLFVPPKSTYQDTNKIFKITSSNDKKISVTYLKNPKAKYVILYSHGNAEDLGGIYPTLETLYKMGFSVISYDYQGYGTSSGKPSERATYADINAVYDYLLQNNVKPEHVILFGRSLGCGPSVELAAHKPVAGLILESAFTSVYRVVTHYPVFMFDKYNNASKMHAIHVPMLFIHGLNDTVVASWHGQELYDTYKGPKEYYWIPDIGHNNIDIESTSYKNAITSFTKTLATT